MSKSPSPRIQALALRCTRVVALAARALAVAAIGAAVALCPQAAVARGLEGGAPSRSIGVSISSQRAGAVIPENFLGLSFETSMLASPQLAGPSPVLATLLRNLGPGVIRVGGVSVDRTQWMGMPEPLAPWAIATLTPAALRELSSLLGASGWRVLLGLDLGHLSATALVAEARAAAAILGGSLQGIAIGNEPDLFTHAPTAAFRRAIGAAPLRPAGWGPVEYEAEISSLRAALAAAGVSTPLYGPDTATPRWLEGYAGSQAVGLGALTQHFYPLDRCSRGRLLKVAATPRGLLSAAIVQRELRAVGGFMRVAVGHNLALRIDEANSVACAGQPGTSDTFAAALWAVELGLIAAEHGVAGINFHGGLGSCTEAGSISAPWYSPLCTQAGGALDARPEYYGLLLLRSLEGSTFLPVRCRSTRDITVHALRAADGSLQVVIDDMEVRASRRRASRRGTPAGPAWITLSAGPSFTRASVFRLVAPSASAKEGVTLGGASVGPDGSVSQPLATRLSVTDGRVLVRVPPASVAVVTLRAAALGGA